MNIRIERTGEVFSFASTEYRVFYPDGTEWRLWSPPWHEMDDDGGWRCDCPARNFGNRRCKHLAGLRECGLVPSQVS